MSVKVSVDAAKIDAVMEQLVGLAIGEVSTTLVDIADDAEANAEVKWYTQVRRRTGRTGILETALRSRDVKLEAVVSATDQRAYVVRRPAALSVIQQQLTNAEYSAAMSQYRKTGTLPPGVEVRRFKGKQPIGLYKVRRNPLAADGKSLWNELVRKDGRKLVLARVGDLDAALQRAADRLRQR